MKVTDAMWDRFVAAVGEGAGGREALEAALADMPDPHKLAVEEIERYATAAMREGYMRAAAEAKLEKVRAWRRAMLERTRPAPDWEALDDILDGAP